MLLLILISCNQDPSDTALTLPVELPSAECGAQSYDFLGREKVGAVLDWEQVEEWSLTSDSIRSLAGFAGVEDTSIITYDVDVYRVRYQTQDRGKLAEATSIVAFPVGVEDPISVVYLHPTTGLEDHCAPSGRDIIWAGVPIALAGLGFAVAAPDYLGQNGFGAEAEEIHPYMIAEPTAINALDSVRSMWAFAKANNIEPKQELRIFGASQGGAGAIWTERYAPFYLPEAEISANIISVPPLNLVSWAWHASRELKVASVGVPLVLTAMNDWYGLNLDISEILQADLLDELQDSIDNDCPESEIPSYVTSLDQIYTPQWLETISETNLESWDPWSCMLAESSVGYNNIGNGTGIPTLMIVGTEDEVALYESQPEAYDTLCSEGHLIQAYQYEGLGHTDAVMASMDLQLSWLKNPLPVNECIWSVK